MKNLNKQNIIAAIRKGRYTIKKEYDCGCQMNWLITKDGELQNDYNSDECYLANVLYVKGKAIAQYIRYGKPEVLIDSICVADIPNEIWNEMMISEIRTRGEGINPLHDKRERESLIDYLTNLVSQGWMLYRDNLRGFSNEYVLYLISPDSSLQIPGTDEKININVLKKIGITEFADSYLWEGDQITDCYASMIVLN